MIGLTDEELGHFAAKWRSAALAASDAWGAQDSLIKELKAHNKHTQELFDEVVKQRDEAKAERNRLRKRNQSYANDLKMMRRSRNNLKKELEKLKKLHCTHASGIHEKSQTGNYCVWCAVDLPE